MVENELSQPMFTYDLVKTGSGEIFSLCGNYDGPDLRARLSYYPDANGPIIIDGIAYRKAKYEIGYHINELPKLLDLPGEQHYLLNRSKIAKTYRASNAFQRLSSEDSVFCESFINRLQEFCQIDKNAHGITGGSLLHERLPSSDFDWVTYIRDPSGIESLVKSDHNFQKELTFSMDHVHKKYSIFSNLNRTDIDTLFANRWKYFRYKNHLVSINLVDPNMRADDLLSSSIDYGDRVKIQGSIPDVTGSYHVPRLIPIEKDKENVVILTWLFLYNGAFSRGDNVEIGGRECQIDNQKFILVETPDDYIRNTSA